MKITCIGAAGGEVTGSGYIIQTKNARILVDCGMFQGGKKSEALNRPPLGPRQKLDAVLITHGHLDHSGRLPLLSKIGYTGPVYSTQATAEMSALILRDSASIQAADAERQNRKRMRAGEDPREPLYGPEDAENIIGRFKAVDYRKAVPVAPGIQAIWAEAGHMLGSASIQVIVDEDGRQKRVVFSGDLGPLGIPIMRDFEPFQHADMVFMECTYGSRDHRPFRETVDEFVSIVKDAVSKKGKILVPTFAVGRAQLLTGLLSWMFRNSKVKPFPAFLDSPMAIEATRIYMQHVELFDDEMMRYIRNRPMREDLKTLTPTPSAADSMKINGQSGPCLVMAGAGMCNAGRILHHLKQNLYNPSTHVLIVGYQAHGSLGRLLVEGAHLVKIHGEKIAVRATVHTMGGFSAHAGQTDLMKWFSAVAPSKPRVVLIHGEDDSRQALAKLIRRDHGMSSTLPKMGESITL
jgi:metallo-beta-lactamase family protein